MNPDSSKFKKLPKLTAMQNTSLNNIRRFQQTNNFSTFAAKHSYFKIFFTLILFLFASLSANAAVTVDSKSSDRDSSLVGLSSLTWTHTVGSGSDRALYVGVSSSTTLLPVSVAPSLLSVATVTYNGIPMTRVGSAQSVPVGLAGALLSKSYVDVYRLVNPPSGAHNVVVNFSTLGIIQLNLFVNQAVGGAVSYNGVDQITPNGFFSSNSGTSVSPNLTVNGGTDQDLIMDVLASSPNARDFTVNTSQNIQWEGNFTPLAAQTFDLGAGSTKAGTSSAMSPVTTNWTLENSNGWVLGGLAVRAASNPPSVFTVNTNLDNESDGCAVGNCTLREAVNDANNTAQPDAIVFAPNVTGSINLTGGQIVASSDITINGPGARTLAVRGDNDSRVFLIATPEFGGDITVNINGLTISNGFAKPIILGETLLGDGGGILNGALLGILSGTSTVNLTEVNVSNNRATTLGGGIATRLNARTNITRSLISNNTGATGQVLVGDVGGGGISNIGGTTTISNTTITNNNSLAAGGGILNAAGRVNLTNSTISHNRATVAGGGAAGWALLRVRADVLARWALRRMLAQLGLLVPLVTRALPLLLVFTVFFFINTEVWQVASAMSAGSLWLAVLLFAALALVFLVARLPEEVDRVVGEVDDPSGERLVRACAGTPLADHAARVRPTGSAPLGRLERVNLLLVLLLVQAGQVVLLAVAVSAFFVLFGVIAIQPSVVESWLGAPPFAVGWSGSPVSVELLEVSLFLAGFSGLYFTVYAVTDPTYREQFFVQITTELERAVGVHAVYRSLGSGPVADGTADPT